MKKIFVAAAALMSATAVAYPQMTLVDKGKPKAQIVIAEDNETNRQAALLLQDFINRISGAELAVTTDPGKARHTITIGGKTDKAGEDGFAILCADGRASIMSGGDKGAIYGVVTLLEKYLGVDYYADETYTLTEAETVALPPIDHSETPAFRYRQSQSYCSKDPIYKVWMRLEEPSEVFIDNMWVHTFDRLLPSDVYGEAHPEYYAYFNGRRNPGNHSQWCLTNPEVFDIVAGKLDSIFKAHPDKKIISVSQNDGNDTYCACDECRAVNEYEGSQAGTYIRFMNKLAARFPDKEISTLAYLFTMKPPRHTRPLPNVNIMLCDIDCKREVPLTDNASGREFVEALEGWAAISDNIFVWDYCINFDNMVSCFPNFHILQDNIRLFHENNATMHFAQAGGTRGCDFAEMRAYVLSKLMWNPYQDTDSLMLHFMRGYYGDATPYLFRYHKIMEGALLGSRAELWIYDSPISHKDGMLNGHLLKTYDDLFDKAEAAVADDSLRLAHVQLSRLPLIYSELEIARTSPSVDVDAVKDKLEYFRRQCRLFGVTTLNERNNSPEEYCDLYAERFLPGDEASKALGARVIWVKGPSQRYAALGETALTDGLFGGTSFVESWVGWEGCDGEFVIDLGEDKEFTTIEADFLQQLGQWILQPLKVEFAISSDNREFTPAGSCSFEEDRSPQVKFVQAAVESRHPMRARYVKVAVTGTKQCPRWHYGVGHPSWFFIDEVSVY